jgi:hypothetical protein
MIFPPYGRFSLGTPWKIFSLLRRIPAVFSVLRVYVCRIRPFGKKKAGRLPLLLQVPCPRSGGSRTAAKESKRSAAGVVKPARLSLFPVSVILVIAEDDRMLKLWKKTLRAVSLALIIPLLPPVRRTSPPLLRPFASGFAHRRTDGRAHPAHNPRAIPDYPRITADPSADSGRSPKRNGAIFKGRRVIFLPPRETGLCARMRGKRSGSASRFGQAMPRSFHF